MVDEQNGRILQMLSAYLNNGPDFIEPAALRDMVEGCGMTAEEAYGMLLAAGCGLDIADNPADRQLYHQYFPQMVRRLDAAVYAADPYYQQIKFEPATQGGCALAYEAYKPCEAFVCDDLQTMADGRIIPQIGFFEEAFPYPAVLEEGRIWMTVTPNEIETMKEPIAGSRGKVLALGLGLGYFAFMAAEKENVQSVTVVEQNTAVISLFKAHILPQFPHGDKIRIVQGDAFAYLQTHLALGAYDVVFADLWHDVSDGLPMAARIKPYEAIAPQTKFYYWIDKSMSYYR